MQNNQNVKNGSSKSSNGFFGDSKKSKGSTNGSNKSSYLDEIFANFALEIAAPPASQPPPSPTTDDSLDTVPLGKPLKTYQRPTDQLMNSMEPRSDDPEKKEGLLARIRCCFGRRC